MYKSLFIVRHGKSSLGTSDISDIDRPLKERGVNDAYTMAERLLQSNNIPDKIISSPAIRALHSATIFSRTFNYPSQDISILDNIYAAEIRVILDIIANTKGHINTLMIFGHNPTFTDLANLFLKDKIDNLPTSGVVGLKFKFLSWGEIFQSKPIESFFDYPKNN